MEMLLTEEFYVAGLGVYTSNRNNRAATDIALLWERFFDENIVKLIPNRISSEMYTVYTNYEGDHTAPYTAILGCKVSSVAGLDRRLSYAVVRQGCYRKFTAAGDLAKGAVQQTWSKIWNGDLLRSYTTDFEVYGKKAFDAESAEVDIYVSLRAGETVSLHNAQRHGCMVGSL